MYYWWLTAATVSKNSYLSVSVWSLSLSLYLSLFLSSLLSLLVYKYPRSSFLFMINNPICPPSPLCLSVSVSLSLYMYTNFPAVLFYVWSISLFVHKSLYVSLSVCLSLSLSLSLSLAFLILFSFSHIYTHFFFSLFNWWKSMFHVYLELCLEVTAQWFPHIVRYDSLE